MSTGDKLSPGFPPIVPRMPEIDFISAIFKRFVSYTKVRKKLKSKYRQIIVPLHPDN
jgi:hypothetical protein